MDIFGQRLKETELTRVELENEKLAFEVQRDLRDWKEREKERAVVTMKEEMDREERAREHDSRQVLELKNQGRAGHVCRAQVRFNSDTELIPILGDECTP